MRMSRLPRQLVMVPSRLLSLAQEFPMHCNPRPSQRREEWLQFDSIDWASSISPLLGSLLLPARVAIHFQNDVGETGTTVAELERIMCADDLPHLEFERFPEVERMYGSSELWCSFIIAIAEVDPSTPLSGEVDPDSSEFERIVRSHSLKPSQSLPPVCVVRRSDKKVILSSATDPRDSRKIAAWLDSLGYVLIGDRVMKRWTSQDYSGFIDVGLMLQRTGS